MQVTDAVSSPPLLVSGANGQLGRALLRALCSRPVRAVVRSERAADAVANIKEVQQLEIHIVDPSDERALATIGAGCPDWVNLVGILKETRHARYDEAHESYASVVARAAAAAGARRVVALSILGATPASENACLSSRGRADEILLGGSVPATVLRLPMVIGPGERASRALARKAASRLALLTRGGASIEQPIDQRDVAAAIKSALAKPGDERLALDLAGPVALPHRELVVRIAKVMGFAPRVLPLPLFLVRGFATLFERITPDPPLSRAMLGVLERDDCIDPGPAARKLGITLTALDEMLAFNFAAPPPS